jgi:hypothetical protein
MVDSLLSGLCPVIPRRGVAMSGVEQRQYQRFDLPEASDELVIQIQSNSGLTMERQVMPVDLSRNGMGFLDLKPLEVGTRCVLLIKHQRTCLRIIGKVAHCLPADETGRHHIGLKFTSLTMVPPNTAGHVLTTNPAVGSLLVHIKQIPQSEVEVSAEENS